MGCNDPPNKHDQPAPTCTNVTRQGLQVRGAALYNIQCIGIEICRILHCDMDIFITEIWHLHTLNINSSFLQIPIRGPEAVKACPGWHKGIPNLKSSAVLSVDGVLYVEESYTLSTPFLHRYCRTCTYVHSLYMHTHHIHTSNHLYTP